MDKEISRSLILFVRLLTLGYGSFKLKRSLFTNHRGIYKNKPFFLSAYFLALSNVNFFPKTIWISWCIPKTIWISCCISEVHNFEKTLFLSSGLSNWVQWGLENLSRKHSEKSKFSSRTKAQKSFCLWSRWENIFHRHGSQMVKLVPVNYPFPKWTTEFGGFINLTK